MRTRDVGGHCRRRYLVHGLASSWLPIAFAFALCWAGPLRGRASSLHLPSRCSMRRFRCPSQACGRPSPTVPQVAPALLRRRRRLRVGPLLAVLTSCLQPALLYAPGSNASGFVVMASQPRQ
jgi:hypothetical protein